ncbi:hypothetical protein Q9295_07615 [Xinfangfangia sp. CPCC 101601]|uniref:Uncharacterized protein n=1 Tax=Pseudogemmobacter lacusdianii TaxID=3069608 RepID=A0ABU0VYG4_9RHOB|nr:hypothetical protein [Xinfangfangia sp. CPCC 101601]MDQ2066235.1 hypothetical protein [Xinfangfangia sp. CPCC 101601]
MALAGTLAVAVAGATLVGVAVGMVWQSLTLGLVAYILTGACVLFAYGLRRLVLTRRKPLAPSVSEGPQAVPASRRAS